MAHSFLHAAEGKFGVVHPKLHPKAGSWRHCGPIQCCYTIPCSSYGSNKGFHIDLLPCHSPTGSWHTVFWHAAGRKFGVVQPKLHPKSLLLKALCTHPMLLHYSLTFI
jgi:hypothetical protein